MKEYNLDMHMHSPKPFLGDEDILLDIIKRKKLAFAVITAHDYFHHDLMNKIMQTKIDTCFGAEVSVIGSNGSEAHLLVYSRRNLKKVEKILENTISNRIKMLNVLVDSFSNHYFKLDAEDFIDWARSRTGSGFHVSDKYLARYLFSISKLRKKIQDLLGHNLDMDDFISDHLIRIKDKNANSGILPNIRDIASASDDNCVLSLAHPQNVFKNTNEFRREIRNYIDAGINAIEINSVAQKAWEHEIMNVANENGLIITFGSDYHCGESIDGKHGEVGVMNPELNETIIRENIKRFMKKIGY